MARRCDRPGCSEVATMRYRMAPEELVFWMGPIDGEVDVRYGVLCRRHADSITVPRGWTLDDSRDPTLRLFRPNLDPSQRPRRTAADRGTTIRTSPGSESTGQQLEFVATRDLPRPDPSGPGEGDAHPDLGATDGAEASVAVTSDDDTCGETDTGVSGLARPPISPLLARAFRGTPLER